jgi:hypothetical protein
MNGIRSRHNEAAERAQRQTYEKPCTLFVLSSQYVLFEAVLACFDP